MTIREGVIGPPSAPDQIAAEAPKDRDARIVVEPQLDAYRFQAAR